MLEVLAFGGVVRQVDRAVVGGDGFLAPPEPAEQVRAGGAGGLEAASPLAGFLEQGVERGQAARRAFDLGDDGGEGDAAAERRRGRVQHPVQGQQRRPVGRAARPAGAVHGLDRGLELEAPQVAARVRRPQVLMRAGDQACVPPRRVLVGQRDESPARVHAGGGARRGQLDEGGEPVRLRVGGRAPGEDLGEVQRLRRRQVPGLRPGRRPVDDIRAVDRLEDGGHPGRELIGARDAKRNAGGLDALLRPDQARRHRRGRHREGPADLLGGEAEHRAEHERRVRGRFDRRVRAHQHQFKPPVRKRVDVEVVGVRERVLAAVERERPLRLRGLPVVAQPVTGDGQQPGVGAGRRPLGGPCAQGALERVRERVFGRGDIAGRGGQEREQPPVTVPGRQAGRLGRWPVGRSPVGRWPIVRRQRVHSPLTSAVALGRTSITPHCAPGHFSAQPMAASRSATSRTKIPASASFVSAKGPS